MDASRFDQFDRFAVNGRRLSIESSMIKTTPSTVHADFIPAGHIRKENIIAGFSMQLIGEPSNVGRIAGLAFKLPRFGHLGGMRKV